MRIALATAQVPFVRGGAELLAESLQKELVARGHEVETLRVPFNWYPTDKLRDSMLAGRLLDLDKIGGHPIDLLIGLKFPAYLARHPNKVFWLIHQHRQAYEQWDDGISDMLAQPAGRSMRTAIWDADRTAFSQRPLYTISRTVSDRLRHYLSIASKPLYHPPPLAGLLGPGEAQDYVLVPSRLNPEKRQDLVLRALAECDQPVRAIFVGAPDDERIAADLRALADQLKIADRVQWRAGISADELARLYREALAVVFVPHNEDYGYVTLEAMLAAKPVVTVADAGGPLEFIEDGRQGLVSPASPPEVARSLSKLWSDRKLARALGEGGRTKYREMGIGWDEVVERLLGTGSSRGPVAPRAASAVIASADTPTTSGVDGGRPGERDDANYDFAPETAATAQRAAVAGISDLFRAFEFGPDVNDEMAAYLESHWLRYLQTAALLPDRTALRILDLGAVRPHVFLGLLKLLNPQASFEAVVEKDYEAAGLERYASRRGSAPPLEVHTTAFNVETDPYPYADNSFDVVLAMEVVEHLALNPAHMFREVARILRPNGSFVVTTPNVSSDMALKKIFYGHAPYSFGVFVPYHGIYGRHNREYAPREIESLGRSAGLSTSRLMTKDVYPAQIDDAHRFASRFSGIKAPLSLRGQNIFYTGLKAGAAPDPKPSSLYLEDPFAFTGSMTAGPPLADEVVLTFANTGAKAWTTANVNLVFTVIGGEARHGRFVRMPLPLFVPAGEQRKLALPIAPQRGEASCTLMVGLERRGHGWLNLIGVRDIRLVAHVSALDEIARKFRPAE